MTNNIKYVNIREVASRVMRHPLMVDITLESIIQYAVDFFMIMGLPASYYDKVEDVHIQNYRAVLPCDVMEIIQVRHKKSMISLRGATDSFYRSPEDKYPHRQEDTFKVQGNIIYTSKKEGDIEIAYRALPVDDEGFPLIPDNSIFLKTLELYIKKEWFTILFDMGKISPGALQNTQQEYAFKAGQLNSEFILPSVSEMESISNMLNQLLSRNNEFRRGFKHLGDREYWKDQR